MPEAQNIDEVLDALAVVVAESRAGGDRIGYFAALYRQVTLAIDQAVRDGQFDDAARMQRFDAAFSNRYFAALESWRAGPGQDGCPRTWGDAFDATRRSDLAVVQHLLLGINAHINVDLAVAAATSAPGRSIHALKRDFDVVNDILSSVLDGVQGVLNDLSPFLRVLDALGSRLDEQVLSFSVRKARAHAWDAAVVLASIPADVEPLYLAQLDAQARTLGRLVTAGGAPVPAVLAQHLPTASVSEIVGRLDAPIVLQPAKRDR